MSVIPVLAAGGWGEVNFPPTTLVSKIETLSPEGRVWVEANRDDGKGEGEGVVRVIGLIGERVV